MIAIALGNVAVPTPGTPVPITAALITAAGGVLPPSGGVSKIEICAVPGNTGVVTVKNSAGVPIKGLPTPANGNTACFCAHAAQGGNTLNPLAFALDAATANDGAHVTLWLD